MYFAKFDKYKVLAYKDGAVYKTKLVGSAWFAANEFPSTYKVDETEHMWVNTTDCYFGATPPGDTR